MSSGSDPSVSNLRLNSWSGLVLMADGGLVLIGAAGRVADVADVVVVVVVVFVDNDNDLSVSRINDR